jgi:hypothetical protein
MNGSATLGPFAEISDAPPNRKSIEHQPSLLVGRLKAFSAVHFKVPIDNMIGGDHRTEKVAHILSFPESLVQALASRPFQEVGNFCMPLQSMMADIFLPKAHSISRSTFNCPLLSAAK